MNNPALYHAITDAGLARRKTIQHIIWEWFADHPRSPVSKCVASLPGLSTEDSVRVAIRKLVTAKALVADGSDLFRRNGGLHKQALYSVNPAMGGKWSLEFVTANAPPKKPDEGPRPVPPASCAAPQPPRAGKNEVWAMLLESHTIHDLRVLRDKLDKLLKGASL